VSFIQRGLKFYINSSLHVAVSVLSLCHITTSYYHATLSVVLQITLFCATVLGYNFVKYFGLARFHYRSLTSKLKEIQILSILCLLIMLGVFFNLKFNIKMALIILGVVTFLYANPFENQITLRQIKGLKVYVIALVWALVTVLIPMFELDLAVERQEYIKVFELFILVLILMLPFEIRDMNFDDLKLSTIPQNIGLKKTKQLGYLGVFFLGIIMLLNNGFSPIVSTILLLLLLGLALQKSHPKNHLNFTAFWVEAIPIFWWVSIWIFG